MNYPKFKSKEECAFPERKICNFSECEKIERCKYMKYNNSKSINDPTRWECIYKKEAQNKEIMQQTKEIDKFNEGIKT